jgi:hypothetical protein
MGAVEAERKTLGDRKAQLIKSIAKINMLPCLLVN